MACEVAENISVSASNTNRKPEPRVTPPRKPLRVPILNGFFRFGQSINTLKSEKVMRGKKCMDDLISLLTKAINSGGTTAIFLILIAFIGYIVLEKQDLQKRLDDKENKIISLIQESNETKSIMTDAINDLKIILAEIKSKIVS